MAEGWIKLHRKLLDSPLWKDCNANQRLVMITILLLANHESNRWIFKGEEFECQPGQFITSLKSLSEASGVPVQSVRSALLKFDFHNFSTSQSTNKNRLITVVNWEKYQGNETTPTIKPTSGQQAANKQPTTNKNDKNIRMIRSSSRHSRHKYGEYGHILLTDEQYTRLKSEYPSIDETIKRMDEWIQLKGKPYKDYNLALRKWNKDQPKPIQPSDILNFRED